MAILYTGAVLGSGNTGLDIGYRVLDADGAEAVAFTTTDVVETGVPGSYSVDGGIDVGVLTAGRVVFGEDGTDYAEAWFGPDDVSGAAAGSGSVAWVYTVTDADSDPIPDVEVWVTNVGGGAVLASDRTDNQGQVTFYLDPGTYEFYSRKAGWSFTNPDTEAVA